MKMALLNHLMAIYTEKFTDSIWVFLSAPNIAPSSPHLPPDVNRHNEISLDNDI